jgi:hypothetical protein
MDIIDSKKTNRRDFITKLIPACTASCFLPCKILGSKDSGSDGYLQQKGSAFDQQIKSRMTYRQYFNKRFKEHYIPVLIELSDVIGREKMIEIIKKVSYRQNFQSGQNWAKRVPEANLATMMRRFRNPNPNGMLENTDPWEIVEDTETVLELSMTECLTAVVFREEGAADIGYATVCHADFALPQGFNPKIRLVRTKTLMEGDDCCNHRYEWTG